MPKVSQSPINPTPRSRRGVAVALIALVTIAILVLAYFIGSPQSQRGFTFAPAMDSSAAGASLAGDFATAEMDMQSQGEMMQQSQAGDAFEESGEATLAPDAVEREIIRVAHLEIETPDLEQSVMNLQALAEKYSGHVAHLNRYTVDERTGLQHANLTVRVEASRLDAAIEEIRTEGKELSVSIDSTDVTLQAQDMDARIDTLETSIERLQKLMADADNIEDLLAAEAQMTQRIADLESITSQRAYLSDQVNLATVEVYLSTPATAVTDVESDGFFGGLVAGWNAFLAFVDATFIGLGFMLPWLVVIAIVLIVVVPLVRARARRKARRNTKAAVSEQPAQATEAAQTTEPSQPSEPVQPAKSTEPGQPSED